MVIYSYDLGIQTFDTANVYSNGLSEVVLGKAIKQHNLPRDEIVVMTKVEAMDYYKMIHSGKHLALFHRCLVPRRCMGVG